jgi:hypothetical protein
LNSHDHGNAFKLLAERFQRTARPAYHRGGIARCLRGYSVSASDQKKLEQLGRLAGIQTTLQELSSQGSHFRD